MTARGIRDVEWYFAFGAWEDQVKDYRELYGSGQEVEVKRATHDGWIWVKARVIDDSGEGVVRVYIEGVRGWIDMSPDSVRKPGEDKR